jgi:hypothetical protein
VFEQGRINGCLSADDSNPYSRIPLLLAEHYKLPTVACHHGALDAIMTLKNPAYSTYLVKGDMEYDYLDRVCDVDTSRLRIGAATAPESSHSLWSDQAPWIVFFTEPYEIDLWRAEAIYREIFPRLCAAARKAGKKVVIKLHPFESVRERRRIITRSAAPADRQLISVTAAPLSQEILAKTWCCVTVESTTALDCATVGIPAFLCGWLRHAYYGYVPQFARFGVGRTLEFPEQLSDIPDMVIKSLPAPDLAERLIRPIRSDQLAQILSSC